MSDCTADTDIRQQLLHMVRAFNSGEVDAMCQRLAEGLIIHDGLSGFPGGREGLRLRLGSWEAALPDLTLLVEGITVTGGEAVMTLTCSGTHVGELYGLAGAGETVCFTAMVRTVWSEGLIAELHFTADWPGDPDN